MEEKQRRAGEREKRTDRRETDTQIDKLSQRGRVRDRKSQMKVKQRDTDRKRDRKAQMERNTHTH